MQGHDQAKCLETLVALGGREVSQSTLTKWEQGLVKRLDEETALAISRYCEEAGLGIAAQLERALTGEPLLSDRQTRLVEGLARRLVENPMTDAEVSLAQALLKSVGL